MEEHLDIRIVGDVQGVFFRHSASEKARALGIRGFVRNEGEWALSIEAEGEEDQLDEFVAWCRRGPPQARVKKVTCAKGELKGLKNFEIIV